MSEHQYSPSQYSGPNYAFVQEYSNNVITDDLRTVIPHIPHNSIDFVIADPPYNLSESNSLSFDSGSDDDGRMGGDWEQTNESWDVMADDEYKKFTVQWLKAIKRVLKPDGNICVFGTYHNIHTVGEVLTRLGYDILNEIVWFKRNAMPNLQCNRFTASHESILWATPSEDDDYYFDYDETKAWPCNAGDITESDKQVRSVWDIPNNKTKVEQEYEHPTQKPLRVLTRLVRALSDEGDVVLDPFAGSGSSLVAANVNNRTPIGIEKEVEYADTAREYLRSVNSVPEAVCEDVGITPDGRVDDSSRLI